MGFGTPPKTGFPGEVGGRLRPAKTWKPIEQATMAYGHGISVNLVQLARAYTMFATDGEVKPVTLLKTDGAGRGPPGDQARDRAGRAHMLEMAAQPGGTAPKAQVIGYRVAGKTGTAHKLEGRGYRANKYVSSFVGFAPASHAAAHRRGDDRRARGGQVLRRRRRRAGVLERDGRGAAHARRADRRAGQQRDPAAAGRRGPGGDVTAAAVALARRSTCRRCSRGSAPFPRRITADSRARRAAASPSPPIRATPPTAAPSSPTRSRAARPPCCGRRAASSGIRDWQVPNLGVEGLQPRLGAIADFIYGSPSQQLWMAGVTGTNGKTSCAQWIAQALDACGRRAAVLGTLGNGLVGALAPATHTTPDVAVLHELLAQFHAAGARAVAMEVSSHGLDQGRVNGATFDVALFTNLTRDHLDYHKTMAAYGAAKARLFTLAGPAHGGRSTPTIAFGQQPRSTAGARARAARCLTYGLGTRRHRGARAVALDRAGIVLEVDDAVGRGDARTRRSVGAFNAQNLLGVLGVLLASGIAARRRRSRRSARSSRRPGRMQRLGGERQPLVVVDYAHTPDALEKVLVALRARGRAAAASSCACSAAAATAIRASGRRWARSPRALADRIVVTSDNPRSEDPRCDRAGGGQGHPRRAATGAGSIEIDRRAAIRRRDRGGRATRRRRAGRRQGPRDVPGDGGRAHAVLRRAAKRDAALAAWSGPRMMDTATAARVVPGRAAWAATCASRA